MQNPPSQEAGDVVGIIVPRSSHRVIFAAFRFATPPPFELLHRTFRGRAHWRRMGMGTESITALLMLGRYGNVANDNAPYNARTAFARPWSIKREMEPRHELRGGLFADQLDPADSE